MNQTTKPLGWIAAAMVVAGISNLTPAHAQSIALDSTWTYASGSSGWIPDTVSIGDEGQRVFSAVGTFGASARLFSESATPIATDEHSEISARHMVDSSETCGRRTWLHYRRPSPGLSASPELRVYDSDSATPSVTYTFPFTVSQPFGGTQISADGSVVCAWVYDWSTFNTAVAVFQGASTTPTSYLEVPTFAEPKAAKLSRDGSALYIATGSKTYLVDTQTGAVDQTIYNFHTVGVAHAINSDGSVYAQGTTAHDLKVMREEGGTFVEWFTHHEPGEFQCSRASFSGDGDTLVASYDSYADQSIKFVVIDLSGAVPTTVFEHLVTANDEVSLMTVDLELNLDGTRAFLGNWGDAAGLVPEVLVYSQAGGSWSQSHSVDLTGSVRDLDIDPAGRHLAVASKTSHATQLGGNGRYDLYELPDAHGIRLVGTPTAGGSVEVRVSCPPDKTGLLLASDQLAATPMNFGGTGRLFLERSGLQFLARTTENGSGELVFTLSLATASAGDTIHVQGLVFGPRRLSPGALTIEVTD